MLYTADPKYTLSATFWGNLLHCPSRGTLGKFWGEIFFTVLLFTYIFEKENLYSYTRNHDALLGNNKIILTKLKLLWVNTFIWNVMLIRLHRRHFVLATTIQNTSQEVTGIQS